MPEPGLVSEVRAVDWRSLKSTYGSGEVVRDTVLGLASRDEAEVRQAWQHISETVLQHQGTVYPATRSGSPVPVPDRPGRGDHVAGGAGC